MSENAPTPVPADAVVCSLPEDQLKDRLAMIRREILPHATRATEGPDGRVWTFAADPRIQQQLEDLIELERQCCEGLRIDLQATPERLELRVRGTELRSQSLGALADEAPRTESGADKWLRVLRAGGLGAAGSFVVFCVLPLAAVATLGAGVTLPFAENPVALAVGALVLAVPSWWLLERRRAKKAAAAGGCGC